MNTRLKLREAEVKARIRKKNNEEKVHSTHRNRKNNEEKVYSTAHITTESKQMRPLGTVAYRTDPALDADRSHEG